MAYVVVIMLIGLITLIWPRVWWKLTRWQYRHPEAVEPSALAFTVGRVGGGVLVLLGFVAFVVAGSNRDRYEETSTAGEETTTTVRSIEAVTQDIIGRLYSYARNKGVLVRQLSPEDFAAAAPYRRDPRVERTMDFSATGQVEVMFPVDGDIFRCLTFRDEGGALTEDHACIPPLERQKARVQKIADELPGEARAQSTSPRTQAVAKKVVDKWVRPSRQIGADTADLERTGTIIVDFDRLGRNPANRWCIAVPLENTGTATVTQTACS